MVRTPSTMLPLGTQAPDFELPNVDGRTVSLADAAGSQGTVVMFICNHCPFVKHVADQLAALGREYMPRGIGFVAISSNDVAGHPADSPEQMVRESEDRGYLFPYLYDETQATARAYHAACTPDFYLRLRPRIGLPRADRFQPPRKRCSRHGKRPPNGDRCVAYRPACSGPAAAQHRLQHQMEVRQRARLFSRLIPPGQSSNAGSFHSQNVSDGIGVRISGVWPGPATARRYVPARSRLAGWPVLSADCHRQNVLPYTGLPSMSRKDRSEKS